MRSIVIFFSRAGENYQVGVVSRGNTQVLAELIAQQTGAALFEIKPQVPYPAGYDQCVSQAHLEKNTKARPAITATLSNLHEYDTVFLGYPNWWSDLPMPVYTFLESHDLSGKTIAPFCTHEGSGLAGTDRLISRTCSKSTLLPALDMYGHAAQHGDSAVVQQITRWLARLQLS